MSKEIYLVRHGETAWSLSGRHTSRTDVPLTENGEGSARRLAGRLARETFGHVFTSPRERAVRTCALAGLGAAAVVDPDLAEWDYGDYEGLRSAQILRDRPGWNIFADGCPNGETPLQVSDRADRVIARLQALEGMTAVFSHGHFGRALAARWARLPVGDGQRFLLEPCALGILGFEHADPSAPVIVLWNEPAPGVPPATAGA